MFMSYRWGETTCLICGLLFSQVMYRHGEPRYNDIDSEKLLTRPPDSLEILLAESSNSEAGVTWRRKF
jgi:hypothetical protein